MLNPYPAYKHAEVPWQAKIPEHWNVRRFRFVSGLSSKTNDDDIERPMFALSAYRGIEVKEYEFDSSRRIKDDSLTYNVVRKHQLVVNPMWVINGSIGVSFLDIEGIVSPAYRVYNFKDINPKFCDYLLRSHFYVQDYNRYIRGLTTYDRAVRKEDFHNIPVFLPPIEEQTAIANFLDARISQINTFIANKEKIIELFKERKAAFINEQLSNPPIPPLAKGGKGGFWEWKKLKYVCKINSEALSETTDPEYKFFYLDISAVTENGISQEPVKQKFQNAPSRARRVVSKGDVIISTVRTYLKAIAYIDKEIQDLIVSTGFAVLKSGIEVNPDFLNYAIRNNATINEITAHSTGIAYPAITSLQLGNFKIPVPPLHIQNSIVEKIKSESAKLDRAIADCQKEIDLIQEYKTALIAEAVTGKIKVV